MKKIKNLLPEDIVYEISIDNINGWQIDQLHRSRTNIEFFTEVNGFMAGATRMFLTVAAKEFDSTTIRRLGSSFATSPEEAKEEQKFLLKKEIERIESGERVEKLKSLLNDLDR